MCPLKWPLIRLNVVRFDGITGQMLEKTFYDTFAESGSTFQSYIQKLTTSDIVAVVSHDDAFNQVSIVSQNTPIFSKM